MKDVREVIEQARHRLGEHGRGTILFLDEIHRCSRAQQDARLPAVEDGALAHAHRRHRESVLGRRACCAVAARSSASGPSGVPTSRS